MKYKTGDKVRVRKDLEEYKRYGCNTFVSDMKSFLGKKLTITRIDCHDYKVKENEWSWTDEMFEDYLEMNIDDLQFGDILSLRNGEKYVYADGHMYGEKGEYCGDARTVTVWYNKDLTQNESDKNEDIIKVERSGQVIYEREDVREMTVEEISKALGYEVKVVK